MRKDKNIFLTGGTGFLGSYLLKKFLNEGFCVSLLIRDKDTPVKVRVEQIAAKLGTKSKKQKKLLSRIEVIKGDVTKKNFGLTEKNIKKIAKKVKSVFHCAALTSFDVERKEEIEKQNVIGTKNVLDFILRLENVHFHYMSTAYVAGRRKDIVTEQELDKNQVFNNPYEESKFKAEKLVRKYYSKYGLKTAIYRPSIIVGDSKTGETRGSLGFYGLIRMFDLLVGTFRENLQKGGYRAKMTGVSYRGGLLHIPLRLPWKENKTLNLVPIDYVSNAILAIFQKDNGAACAYHIVNPNSPQLKYLKDWICDFFNITGPEIVNPSFFRKESLKPWESLFLKAIEQYNPYLQHEEPKFTDDNTQKMLKNASIRCPLINKKLLFTLIEYCIKTKWGQNIV